MSFFFQASPAHQFVKSPAWQRVNGTSPLVVEAIACGGRKLIGGFRPIVPSAHEPPISFEIQPKWLDTQLANLQRYRVNSLETIASPEAYTGQPVFFNPPNQARATTIAAQNVYSVTGTPYNAPPHPDNSALANSIQGYPGFTETWEALEHTFQYDDGFGSSFAYTGTLSDPFDPGPFYVTARERFLALDFDAEPNVPGGQSPGTWSIPHFSLGFREWELTEYSEMANGVAEPGQHLYAAPWDGSNVVALGNNPDGLTGYAATAYSGWSASAGTLSIVIHFWRSKLRCFGPAAAPFWIVRVEHGAGWGTLNGIGFGQHIYRTTLIQQGTIASGQTIARGTNPELPFPNTSYFDADIMHAGFLKTSDLYFAGIGNTPQDFLTANNLSYGLKIKA